MADAMRRCDVLSQQLPKLSHLRHQNDIHGMRLTVALRLFALLVVMVTASAQQSPPTNSSTDANTTETTTTTASTTTTTAATTTANVHPNPSVNQICPQGPDSTDRVRVNALQGHNFRRSQLARGRVKKNNGNTLPKAANMRRLLRPGIFCQAVCSQVVLIFHLAYRRTLWYSQKAELNTARMQF
ncbi:hypothetical protein COOONC_23764 [Cooperia oncophora]